MKNIAPVEFSQLGLDTNSFMRSDNRSWRGACPRCGGHRRFVIFTDKQFPNWNYFCDGGCGMKGWAKDLNPQLKQEITEAQRAEWRERNERDHHEREAMRVKRLAEFTTTELWEELHSRLSKVNRAWWRTQGIPDELQDFWHLGYERDHTYETPSGKFCSSAYTIPYFNYDGTQAQFKTMQYRMQDTLNPNDRYRFAHGLKSTYFDTYPNESLIVDTIIICEGAKKAMNVAQIAKQEWRVIAMPSKSGDYGVTEATKDAKKIFIILDPDGLDNAHKKAIELGNRASVISLPYKIDDGIMQYGFGENSLYAAMKNSRR